MFSSTNSDQSSPLVYFSESKIIRLVIMLNFYVLFTLYIFRYTGNRYVYIPFPPVEVASYFYLLAFIIFGIIIAYPQIQRARTIVYLSSFCVFLLSYFVITILWAPNTTYSVMKTYYSIELAVIYIMSVLLFSKSKQSVRLFYLVILAFVFTVSLELSYEYIIYSSLTSPHFTEYYITINRILGVAIPISLFIWFTYKRTWIRASLAIFILLQLFFMLQTGGRGPLIAAIISTITYIIWVLIHKENWFSIRSFSSYISLSAILTIIATLATQTDGLDTLNRLQLLLSEGPGNSILSRFRMGQESIQLFTQSPIFGHGVGSFQTLVTIGQYSYPHNIFLEFLVESGFIGFVMLLSYVLAVFVVIVRYGRDQPIYSGLILSVFTFGLMNALVSGDIESNRRLFIYSATAFSLVKSE